MPTSKTVIFGIDPGIADTGYSVICKHGSSIELLEYGAIKTPAGAALETRLQELYDSLEHIFTKHQPSVIAVEKLFFAKNSKTALTVGHARGTVLLLAGQKQLTLYEYTPMQVKLALTSYGKASKKQIQQMVTTVLKLKTPPKSDDAADALAVAICCAHSLSA